MDRQSSGRIGMYLLLAALLLLSCVGSALADVYKDAGFIKKIPMKPKYTEEVENKGTVEKITYTCHAYALEAINEGKEIMVEKDMYVYLPYGYSADQDYNVIYLMHGGGEDEKYWLTLDRMGSGTLAMLDNINFKGDCEPTIIVTPTTNTGTMTGSVDGVEDETIPFSYDPQTDRIAFPVSAMIDDNDIPQDIPEGIEIPTVIYFTRAN